MKLTFFGAAKAVTGSCHCVEVRGKKILIDCGLQQGRDERDNAVFDFSPNYIDYVIVTHAHIDHSGRIPLLIKEGFQGQIFTTRLTGQLLSVMLQDSAHIQEQDAQWKNQKGKRAGRPPVEPLYTVADAAQVAEHLVTAEYGQIIELFEGVKIRFVDAGHLLGSASVEMWMEEGGVEKKIVFSGDIGNVNQPIIRDPSWVHGADYVVMESTYGDRNHAPVASYTAELAKIIDDTFSKGGNVIIPSFAVGRTQELLYFMREMKKEGLVKSNPDFTVCVDSPLANEATKIFSGDLRGYLDEEALEVVKEGERLFTFPGLMMTESSEESKLLNLDKSSKVIISASGMCDAGRIRHHLKYNLWRPECTVLFVGYQSPGTLGNALVNGAQEVKLFGEPVQVRARIAQLGGLSGHADKDGLEAWLRAFDEKPKFVFVNHGEDAVAEHWANHLKEEGYEADAPYNGSIWIAAEGRVACAEVGNTQKIIKTKSAETVRTSAAYDRLANMGQRLLEVIRHNQGGANKDLAKFASQIAALCDKWDR